ncbi:glycosyltransferase family 4 protein [Phormidesmis priestleyi]
MKKISLVVSDLSQSGVGRWGGGAVRPFLLSQALRKIGYEVEIVGFVFEGHAHATFDSEIPVKTIPAKNYPAFFANARQLLDQIDGDILYAYKTKLTSLGLALLKKGRSNRPVISDIDDWEMSWHGGDRWQYRPNLRQLAKDLLKSDGALRNPDHPLYLHWAEQLVSRADVVTVHTEAMQKRFGGVYIPNGKDTALFDPDRYDSQTSRDRYSLSDYKILMFPGAPRPYKGVEDVLTALDLLNQPDLRLVIVGGSPYDDYDNQLIEKWGRWIIKLPKASYESMPEIVSAAHAIIIPQRDDPATTAQFPLKLTDGMAMAKPVLSTTVGDVPKILGDTGYLVAPSSPEQLADKISWIFQNLEEASDQGRRARERCIKYYSVDAMATILSSLISDL